MNPYVIPGLEEKIDYLNKINKNRRKGVLDGLSNEGIRVIHQRVSHFFNLDIYVDNSTRNNELVNARHWSMFIAKCKGYSHGEIASYFNRDKSIVAYVTNKIIDQIELYEKSKEIFDSFINSESLLASYKGLLKGKLKKWLQKYYKKHIIKMSLVAVKTPHDHNDYDLRDAESTLNQFSKERENLYNEIITARERNMVDAALIKINNKSNRAKDNRNTLPYIII